MRNMPDYQPLKDQLEPSTQSDWMNRKHVRDQRKALRSTRRPPSRVLFTVDEDEEGLGFRFRPMKAIKRIGTITKTSFQPKKILGAVASLTATIVTGGLGPMIAPKIFSANSKTMQSLGYGMAAIAVVAGAVVLGPALAASMGPMLSSAAGMVGKAVTGMSTFMGAFNKLAPKKQEELSRTLTAEQIAAVENGQLNLDSLGSMQATPASTSLDTIPVRSNQADFGQPLQQGGPMQAGMMGGIDPMMLMIGGATLLGVFLFQRKAR